MTSLEIVDQSRARARLAMLMTAGHRAAAESLIRLEPSLRSWQNVEHHDIAFPQHGTVGWPRTERIRRPAPLNDACIEHLVAAALCAPDPLASDALDELSRLSDRHGWAPRHGPRFLTYGSRRPTDREWSVASHVVRLNAWDRRLSGADPSLLFIVGDASTGGMGFHATTVDRNEDIGVGAHQMRLEPCTRFIDLATLDALGRWSASADRADLLVDIHPTKGLQLHSSIAPGHPTKLLLPRTQPSHVRVRTAYANIIRTDPDKQWAFANLIDTGLTALIVPDRQARPSASPLELACWSAVAGSTRGALERLQDGERRCPTTRVTALSHGLSVPRPSWSAPVIDIVLRHRLQAWGGAWLIGCPAELEARPMHLRDTVAERLDDLMPCLESARECNHLGTSAPDDR
jgi:hypothetical protein